MQILRKIKSTDRYIPPDRILHLRKTKENCIKSNKNEDNSPKILRTVKILYFSNLILVHENNQICILGKLCCIHFLHKSPPVLKKINLQVRFI